ncbi:hypothetical protein [Pseudomonas aeruginosa]|uniref:hypothetical protein n=1 Tax=Pseudomonas aeruginosa TaxID=287 RepID=UPI0019D4D498|nr:hypothetical protein [Pseudomonas aeruginosa]MCH0737870.1 hypothetical protein [Pseudomonas aeruginosa]
MKIDRTTQKAVLDRLADAYPNPVQTDGLSDLFDDTEMLTACCAYLHEHGLIRAKITDFMSEGASCCTQRSAPRESTFWQTTEV